MKVVIDISADDFNAIRQGRLYFIGHDRLDQCITEAFQSSTIIPKGHGDLIDRNAFIKKTTNLYCENCERRMGMKKGKKQFVYDIGDAPCRACEVCDLIDDVENAQTVIEADKENEK
jgi:hypothetical protein